MTSSSTTTSPYKPSPLSYNSPRTSPFRRPESPFTRSPSTIRSGSDTPTPTATPFATAPIEQPGNGYSKDKGDMFNSPSSKTPTTTTPSATSHNRRPDSTSSSYFGDVALNPGAESMGGINSGGSSRPLPLAPKKAPASTMASSYPNKHSNNLNNVVNNNNNNNTTTTTTPLPTDPLSRLPPTHLLPMREAFSILDRSNTGTVTRADIADMLRQLGMDSSERSIDAFFSFPSSSSSISSSSSRNNNNNNNNNNNDNNNNPTVGTKDGIKDGISLPVFLATLSSSLPHPSVATELEAAFAAFDDADNGQADWEELREAVCKEAAAAASGGGDGGGNGKGKGKVNVAEIDAVMDAFRGRRMTTAKGLGRGDVFRYQDFVAAVTGGAGGGGNGGGNGSGSGRLVARG